MKERHLIDEDTDGVSFHGRFTWTCGSFEIKRHIIDPEERRRSVRLAIRFEAKMGGSDSRCCVDSDEKALQECAVGYKQASQLQSPFQSTGTKIVRMDPRSPSSRVDRTPIQVSVTPSAQPKPLMRVQPMIEREPAVNSSEKISVVHANKIIDEAVLLDPRSPAALGSRTPILTKSKQYEVMQDPRSPTLGIVRTPLLETITNSNQSSCAENVILNEGNDSCDFAICQTPQKHVYAMTNTNKKDGEAFQGVFDPRSPSDGIHRTPLGKLQGHDDVFLSDEVHDQIYNGYEDVNNICDPRSPSQGIERTPVEKIQDQEVASVSEKCHDDPYSSNSGMPRTPLGAIFSGRRELRRTVLLSNALMASPLTVKITHSSLNTSNQELDQAESFANQNFLNIPSRKLGNFDESRSSSVIAVMGSDVDSLSNLDESIDGNQDSHILNVVDVSKDEEITQHEIDDKLCGKQIISHGISHRIVEGPCDALLKNLSLPHGISTSASEYGTSVDSDERFVTAKFSTLSTDDEYLSSQEVIQSSRRGELEGSNGCNIMTPLFDDSASATINFVTTYEILDDDSDVCTLSDHKESKCSDTKICPNEHKVPTTSPNLINTNLSECDIEAPNGEMSSVNADASSNKLREENGSNDKMNVAVDNANLDNLSKVISDFTDENLAGTSTAFSGDGCIQNYSVPEEKALEHDSSGSSTSKENNKDIFEEKSRSDSESVKSNNTPTTSNKKKPKRRLRTPKAVTRKHRHISTSSNALSSCNFGLEATRPKSLSNSQLSHTGMSFGSKSNTHISPEIVDSHLTAVSRSPLSTLTNDFGKSAGGMQARKNRGAHPATKLPRYQVTPKAAGRSLPGSIGGQSAKRKTVRNKEN